ncbi:unnamed protein product [Caenorhabditis nigoni]
MKSVVRTEQVWGDEHLSGSHEWPPKTPEYAQPLEATKVPKHWVLVHMGVDENGARINIYLDKWVTRLLYVSFRSKTRHSLLLFSSMSAVFSGALVSNNGPKTRYTNPIYQPPKSYSKNSTNSTNSTAKQSNDEANLGAKSNQRTPTNGSPTQSENPRTGHPEDEQVCNASDSRKKYLGEKAATVEMPTDEMAQLCTRFLYDDSTLIITMCMPCRIASRNIEMQVVDEENQNLVVNLCKICRSTLKAQLTAKFFKHQLPCFKRLQQKQVPKRKDLKKFVL